MPPAPVPLPAAAFPVLAYHPPGASPRPLDRSVAGLGQESWLPCCWAGPVTPTDIDVPVATLVLLVFYWCLVSTRCCMHTGHIDQEQG